MSQSSYAIHAMCTRRRRRRRAPLALLLIPILVACGGSGSKPIEVNTIVYDCNDGRELTMSDTGWHFDGDASTPGTVPESVFWGECK